MTETEPSAPASSKRSPGVVAAIVIVVVIALAGGAFLVYKLTKTKDEPAPALRVAKEVVAAVAAGDAAVLRSHSTGEGTTQLLALQPDDAGGVKLTAASCKPFAARTPTRVCTATRPGGQLALRLIFTDGAWTVDFANVGPIGLPPTSTTTPT
jgi:hypothetical protein